MKNGERGSVLVYTVILVTVAVFLALGFLGSREEWLRGENRRLLRTFSELDSEIGLNDLSAFIQNQIATSLSFDPGTLTGANGPLASATQSSLVFNGVPINLYSYTTSIVPTSVINLSPVTYPTDQLQLLAYPATSLFDPLYGARALSSAFTITQAARTVSNTETEYSNRQRVTTVEIRQVPLSVFTVFSNASPPTPISPVNFPNVQNGAGRVHIEGSAQISGNVRAIYPFTVTGSLSIPSGATLTAQRSPSDVGSAHTADTHYTVDDLKGAFENVIVDQDVNHSHVVIVPDLVGKISTQCQIAIVHSEGATPIGDTFAGTAQQGTSPATAASIAAKMTVDQTSWLSKSFPNKRIIDFDFNIFRGNGVTSYYITSTDKTAVILIKNAGVLNQNLSIVSDLAVWVSNGFNDGTVTTGTEQDVIYGTLPGGYNSSLYNASIVTSQNVVGVNTGP